MKWALNYILNSMSKGDITLTSPQILHTYNNEYIDGVKFFIIVFKTNLYKERKANEKNRKHHEEKP